MFLLFSELHFDDFIENTVEKEMSIQMVDVRDFNCKCWNRREKQRQNSIKNQVDYRLGWLVFLSSTSYSIYVDCQSSAAWN